MGVEVANYYQTKAVEHCANMGYAAPKALAFLEGELFDDYMHDMALSPDVCKYESNYDF